jgi:hypothetical protein
LVLACPRGDGRRRRPWIAALSAVIAFVFVAAFAAPSRAATYTAGITQDTTGVCADPAGGKCSLRQLVNYENSLKTTPSPTDTIQVPAGFYGLSNGALSISQSVSIVGAGARTTTVDQLSSTPDRDFDIQSTTPGGTIPTVSITGFTIENGTANANNGSRGGNVRNQGNLTLSEDWIFLGTAGSGGGISNDGGGLTVTHSLVSDNTATTTDGGGDSGGIQNYGDSTVGLATLSIIDSTIANNNAQTGGGVYSWCGTTPCTSKGNNRATIVNSTVVDNGATSASGGLLQGATRLGPQGTISVQNSIVAFNTTVDPATGAQITSNCGTSGISSSGFNIESAANCGFTQTGDLQKTDPGFTASSYQNHGGNTQTFVPDAKSPAVDAIPIGTSNCGGSDQRDVSRPQGTGCDIGAVEVFQPTEGQSAQIQVFASNCGSPFGQATIDWGDGTPTSLSNSGTFIGTHTYAEAGLYAGSVTYQDDCGTHTKVPFNLKAQDAPLTPKASAISATAGVLFKGEVATFTDGKPDAPISDFASKIDWGDGTTSAGTVTSVSGGYSVAGSHTYSTPGPYQTTISIFDKDGSSASVQGSANVATPPPTVTGVSPSVGPAAGGTSVTITGTNLNGATAVKFGAAAATIASDGATSITATAPPGTGTVDVTVTTAGGTSATSGADQFTYGPTIKSVNPTSGPAAGGTVVTITGTGFTNATAVSFGNQSASSFNFVSDTKITATSPGGTGTLDITVTTPAGISPTSAADQFTYGPTVSGLSPSAGPTSGSTSVTITGTGFTNATGISFGGTAAKSFTVNSATKITAVSPAASAGTVDVTVTTPAGTSPTGAATKYAYVAPPTVTSVSPTSGPTGGGTSVTITGTNLGGATGVRFGNAAAVIVSNTATTIVATAPSASAGQVDITVTTAGGTSATDSGDQYTYVAAPTVTGINPSTGPAAGGTSVTVTGANLTGASDVKFGSTSATIKSNTATSIVATSPAGTGTVDVTVTTVGGTSPTSGADQFTYGPTVTSVAPSSGPAAGGTDVVIIGTGLANVTGVTFGSTAATSFTPVSDTRVVAKSPAGTGTVDITVTTPAGTSPTSAADQFSYAPAITSLSPSAGPTAGGTSVKITGVSFSGANAVRFGDTPAKSFNVDGPTQITAVSPPGTAGSVLDVTVVTGAGTSPKIAADRYTYVAAPTIGNVSPTSGPTAGGTSVTITGTNLSAASDVKFGGASAVITSNTATTIVATAPAQSAGTVHITVTTAGGTSATANGDQYTYVAPPTVSSISPTHGPAAGGTSVTITGTNLSGASDVKFGSASAMIMSNTATSITATSPAGTGTVDVTVTTVGGTSATGAPDQFTYGPTVASVSPNSGAAAGGTVVTITGTGFTDVNSVSFGSVPAISFSFVSDATVTAKAPPGTGTVDITLTTPAGTSPTSAGDQFSYGPTVTSVSPSAGPTAGGTSITITGENLLHTTAVSFGGTAAKSFSVSGPTQITAVAPSGSPGTVDITVAGPAGASATGPADHYTYVAAPTVTGVSPNSGPTAGGTSVTITGTDLIGATAVQFGGAPASSFTVNGPSQITATSPPGSGTADVTVTATGGTSGQTSADHFSYQTPPPAAVPGTPSVSLNKVALEVTVNPNGSTTAVHWELGLDSANRGPRDAGVIYDQSTPNQTIGSDFTNHTVQATVSNLIPNSRYHVRVIATNSAGTTTGPDQTFTSSEAPAPPPPALGKTENFTPSGTVFVLLNGKFVKLTQTLQLPSGTIVDALQGSVTLVAASGAGGQAHDAKAKKGKPPKPYTGTFGGAVFRVTQARSGPDSGLTTLSIVENAFAGAPSYTTCKTNHAADGAHAALSSRVLQTLRSRASGRFRTRGRYAAGTVRGTQWTTTDRCDGTLISVQVHAVQVTDFVKHVVILIRAGHHYLATPVKGRNH